VSAHIQAYADSRNRPLGVATPRGCAAFLEHRRAGSRADVSRTRRSRSAVARVGYRISCGCQRMCRPLPCLALCVWCPFDISVSQNVGRKGPMHDVRSCLAGESHGHRELGGRVPMDIGSSESGALTGWSGPGHSRQGVGDDISCPERSRFSTVLFVPKCL
jgi:hypothetical protein